MIKKALHKVKELTDYYIEELDEGLPPEQIESIKHLIESLNAGCQCDTFVGFDCGCTERKKLKEVSLKELNEKYIK